MIASKPRSKALHAKPVLYLLVPVSLLPALCCGAPLLRLLCLPPQLYIFLHSSSSRLVCSRDDGVRTYTLACKLSV